MIDTRICQLCGQDVGREGASYTEATFDVPLCPFCADKIKKHMRQRQPVILDMTIWKSAQESPIKLPRKLNPGVRRKDCLYWP
jgi:hypothetical protein